VGYICALSNVAGKKVEATTRDASDQGGRELNYFGKEKRKFAWSR